MNATGQKLSTLGIEVVEVPAGSFFRGGESAPDEMPYGRVWLNDYRIATTPLTNAQYRTFVEATGHRTPPLFADDTFGLPDHPVVGVSWHDANAYCAWLSAEIGAEVALPTEAQWERAGRGDNGQTYSWGDAPPRPDLLNAGGEYGGTTPVGKFPVASPFGLFDVLGNVWEWCQDRYGPYQPEDDRDPRGPNSGDLRTTRGGSWRSDLFRATCHHRCFMNPSVRSDRHGFRIALAGSGTS